MKNGNENITLAFNGQPVDYVRADLSGNTYDPGDKPYVIVRSREQGVMCGYIRQREGRVITLERARQIWQYDSQFVLVDLAEKGARDSGNCKLSCELSQDMIMLEACGVYVCSKEGGESLRAIAAQGQ